MGNLIFNFCVETLRAIVFELKHAFLFCLLFFVIKAKTWDPIPLYGGVQWHVR